MKRIIHKAVKSAAFALFFCMGAALFAYTPYRIEAVDTRSEGFGGPYFTDTSSLYALFSNPAALAFTKEKTLLPPITAITLSGPLDKMLKLGLDSAGGKVDLKDPEVSAGILLDMIGDSGFSFGTKIGGPLTFGAIRNNFDWGFINTTYADGSIFSLSRSDIRAGTGLAFVAGYGFPFDFGKGGILSVGLSGRGTVQFETIYTKSITAFISEDPMKKLPFYLSLGLGFDMGIQYSVGEIMSFALVYQDVYTPTWTKIYRDMYALEKLEGGPFTMAQTESKLGFGVKAELPIKKIAGNIVPEWVLYADYNNIWPLLLPNKLYRNPILELAFGTEVLLFHRVLALRLGVNDMYPAAGIGLNLGKFKMDFSVFGKELGLEPGFNPQLNVGFSMLIKY